MDATCCSNQYNVLKLKRSLGVPKMQQLPDFTAEGLHLSEIST
jgi:hypothetical protein